MIKRILSFTLSGIAAISMTYAAADTVELTAAGTLKDAVTTPASVTSLTVSGPMDAADFDFINRNMPALTAIDLSGANIVAYVGTPVLTGYSASPADVLPAYALHGMKLTSVTLPASVTSLGEGALAGIAATTLSLPHVTAVGDGAFAGAAKLTSVTLSSSEVTLGRLVFSGCSSLTSMTIEADRMSDGVFKDCTSLSSISLPAGLESIGKDAFMGCKSLKAFAKCAALASVVLPESVQTVGQGAFFDDAVLASVILPSDLKNVEDFVMTGNAALNDDAVIPANAESIGRYAYKGMSGMERIVIPAGVTSIGDNAMEGMTSLAEIDAKSLKAVPELGQDVWKDVEQPEVALLVGDAETGELFKDADQWKEFKIDIPSLSQDIVISDRDEMADVKVGFEGRILVITAASGLKDAVVGDINGVLVPASSVGEQRATFDTSGMGEDFYTVSVTTADGRRGQFKLLRK